MRCCATCRGHRSPRWHRSRFPANGAAPRGGRYLKAEAWGLAGRDGFAGDAVNPSVEAWPRHPCRGHPRKSIPPGHGQFPCAVHHGKEREDQKRKRIASLCIHAWRGSTVSTKVDTYRQSQFTHRHRESVGGGAVWGCTTVGAMGPRHASGGLGRTPNPGLAVCAGQCTRARRHRAPRGEGALVAKHCFASARTHRPPAAGPVWGFTACPAAPHRPAQPSAIQSCCCRCCCLCRYRAASPAKATTSPSLQSPAMPGSPATAAASATPGSSHHAGPAAAATPATTPPRCNRAHPRAARR